VIRFDEISHTSRLETIKMGLKKSAKSSNQQDRDVHNER
jgi:hypothetical protein